MRTFFLAIACLLSWQLSLAQPFLLKGKVVDNVTQNPLPGAIVIVRGTTLGTITDLNGGFELKPVKTTKITLDVTYLGYEAVAFEVTPSAIGQVQMIQMKEQSFETTPLTINGVMDGQAKALNQQRAADNIRIVVAADQIGRFPDPNAAEALQRVPGVNIERDQGEGRYVLIRGLAPQFTNISVNGEQIPSPEASVRYVALDAIPADQLASMEISKSLMPDMDGDAIGGSVNLITRTAQSAKPSVNGSLSGGYNNLMGRFNGQGNLQYGQRFGKNEKLGIMLNVSHYTNHLGSDNWERDIDDDAANVEAHKVEIRDYELTRTRFGASTTIDYTFNPAHQVYVRGMFNRFTDREWRRRYVFAPEDDEIERLTKDRFESQSIASFNAGGVHSFAKLRLDYEVAYALAEQNTPYDNEVSFLAEDVSTTFDFATDPEYVGIKTSESYLDNSLYGFNEFETGHTLARDQNVTGKFNVNIPYTAGNGSGYVKAGAKVRLKTKSYTINQNKYEALGDVPDLSDFTGGLLDDNFLGGKYALSAAPEMGKFITFFNANPQEFELQIEDKAVDEALESYEATENVYAGYVMARHQFTKLMLLGGVRYERTDVTYDSKEAIFALNGDLQEIKPVSGSNTYDFVLPQFHLKYALSELSNIRAAAVFSYARPNFDQIVPAQEAQLGDGEASIGNAELLPVGAFNGDLLYERYFGNVGIISGGVFFKSLNNFIYTRRFLDNYPLNSATPLATDILYTQAQNGEQATLIGGEIALQRQLDFLPGALKGLGLYVNYTYTNSQATIQRGESPTTETLRLPGQATHVGNVSLAYNHKKFGVRLSANFNGQYLSEIGSAPANDLYVKQRMQVDASASYALTPKWRFFAECMNLTNQPFETFAGSESVMVQREFYGWWVRAGVKFTISK